jgi:putative alpha-1,2-mannosidase
MKKLIVILVVLILFVEANAQSYNKYVNTFIGTSATGHTFPGATVPFGIV